MISRGVLEQERIPSQVCEVLPGQFAQGTEKSTPTVTPDPDLESI
jgi:hypothetical protein